MFDEVGSSKMDYGHDDIDFEEFLNVLGKMNGEGDKENEGEKEVADS